MLLQTRLFSRWSLPLMRKKRPKTKKITNSKSIYFEWAKAQSRQSARLFLQSSELGLPRPLIPWRVCFPLLWFRGRDILACGRSGGRGVSIRTRRQTLQVRWYSRFIFTFTVINQSMCEHLASWSGNTWEKGRGAIGYISDLAILTSLDTGEGEEGDVTRVEVVDRVKRVGWQAGPKIPPWMNVRKTVAISSPVSL
jgi:hypothetical protein